MQVADSRRVASCKTDGNLGRNFSERAQHRDQAHNAERLNTRSRRRIGTQYHSLELSELFGGAQGEECCFFIPVMNNLEGTRRVLAERDDLIIRYGSAPPVDTPHHVSIGC